MVRIRSFLRALNSQARKVLGKPGFPVVGITDIVTKESKIPIRLFFPSSAESEGSVGWFVRGFDYFIDGYMHTLLPSFREYALVQWLLVWISYILSWLVPMGHSYLPNCAYDVPVLRGSKLPLIIFSHGLTGTGEEHALMFAYWAQRGYVVASLHHCDGSSSKVPRGGDEHLLYEHPDYKNYDENFRPRQVETREEELFESLQFVLHDPGMPAAVRAVIAEEKVIVAGFSYGAATAALSVTKRKGVYKACFLLDGWFYIDLGEGMKFPAAVHEKGLDIPALFIGSEHFANWKTCAKATDELSKKNTHEEGSVCYVGPGSRHQNFTDVGFWLPLWLLRKTSMIGACDYHEQYSKVLDMTTSFFDLHMANN